LSVEDFPALNATLNSIATLFLLGGWFAIKKLKRQDLHKYAMVAALVCSAAFLACYLYYHYHTGHTTYEREGLIRYVYFFILMTHIPLAGLMVPFILAAVWFAFRGQYAKHLKIVRYLWPVWMYVSVTGVIIYVMLYQI
jgi:putative membrane protein